MPALSIQMHLHGNPSLLQRNVVRQRIVYVVHVVVLRRRLIFGTLNRHLKEQRLQRKSPAASSAGRLVPVELAPRKLPTQFHNFLRLFTAV